jgi:hypothetical protein
VGAGRILGQLRRLKTRPRARSSVVSGRALTSLDLVIGRGGRRVVGVQQWAEIQRLVLVEGRSQPEVALLMGLARETVAKAVLSKTPPK